MPHRFACVPLVGAAALVVLAGTVLRPDPAPAQAAKYEIAGFRDARFGMTVTEVRAVARASFGAADDEMTVRTNAIDGTTMLIVHAPTIEPGLGEGRIAYLFGYSSGRLIQVNVVWGEDTNPPLSDRGMIEGGARLQQFFLGFGWRTGSVRFGIPIGDNSVLLFSGEDARSGAVRLVIEGIHYQVPVNGQIVSSPEPLSPPKLTISYIADRYDPDVRKISRQNF